VRIISIPCVALAGCTASQAAPLEQAQQSALLCIEQQVPDGKKVSAEQAQRAVSNCAGEFETWSRALVESAFDRRFDPDNPKMAKAYNRVLNDKRELMQLRISNEFEGKFPAI
jgi:patatin-like phospholipase/acyl hydrolase